ncbi:hypothetical protein [Frigidibacter mobilis]|uniref:hypothetical protein n=1 Tax=Frigidibacter mobilis TaxID=1335048 RepID=UPI00082CEEA6|nr:hypothetical protein [Frigidibacter mobilis]
MQPEPGRSQEQQVATDDPADREDDDEDEEETAHFGVRGLESRFLAPVRRMVSRFWQAPPSAVPRAPAQPRGLRALLTRFLMPSRFRRRPVAPPLPPEQPSRPLKSRFDQSAGPKL